MQPVCDVMRLYTWSLRHRRAPRSWRAVKAADLKNRDPRYVLPRRAVSVGASTSLLNPAS